MTNDGHQCAHPSYCYIIMSACFQLPLWHTWMSWHHLFATEQVHHAALLRHILIHYTACTWMSQWMSCPLHQFVTLPDPLRIHCARGPHCGWHTWRGAQQYLILVVCTWILSILACMSVSISPGHTVFCNHGLVVSCLTNADQYDHLPV